MAFAMGISLQEFKHLTPKKLEYCLQGYKIRRKMQDENMWRMGLYVQSAVATAIEHNFSKKAKSKYIEKPILQDSEQNGEMTQDDYSHLSEEEKIKKTQDFFAKIERMGENFNRHHKGGKA